MKIKKLTKNLLKAKKYYATRSKAPGYNVYGEKKITYKGSEYRVWNPSKSKLCAALHNNMPLEYIKKIESAKSILYLGIADGTTASHLEDLNPEAFIFGVEISPRSMINLFLMIKNRKSNIIPILENASFPERYVYMMTKVDIMYVDIAQPHQTDIALKNADLFLKDDGIGMISIKTRSIDIKSSPKKIIQEEIKKIKKRGYAVLFRCMLNPFEKDHGFVIIKRKKQDLTKQSS